MNEQSTSPVVKKIEEKSTATMDFFSAVKVASKGIKVHKLEWEDKGYFGILKDGFLMLHKPDGKYYQWIISEGDLTGTDYIVV